MVVILYYLQQREQYLLVLDKGKFSQPVSSIAIIQECCNDEPFRTAANEPTGSWLRYL